MTSVLLSIPAVLSFVMLAAHFLRMGRMDLAIACLALPTLLAVRRSWSLLILQWGLLAGSAVWLWTMLQMAESRASMGLPAGRMIVIMSSVAGWTLISAILLEFTSQKRRKTLVMRNAE